MYSYAELTPEGKFAKLTTPVQLLELGDEVYLRMTGAFGPPRRKKKEGSACSYDSPLAAIINNEYEGGGPAEYYFHLVQECRARLREKLGIVQGGDDDDVLQLLALYDGILRQFVRKAFAYGYQIGAGDY